MDKGAVRNGPPNTSAPKETPLSTVQAQVERILASPGFSASQRHSKLLRHLVSMSLADRGSEIKEYVLGVELFGRGDSFDPQTDTIVRAEVSRLRAKLRTYYSAEGLNDPVVIDLPSRSYAPVFTFRDTPTEVAVVCPKPHSRKWYTILVCLLIAGALVLYGSFLPSRVGAIHKQAELAEESASVAVLPFVNSDSDPEVERLVDSLTAEVIESLSEISGLRVLSRETAFQFKGKHEDPRTVAAALNVGVLLEGAVRRSGKHFHVIARLLNAADGSHYYSHVYEPEVSGDLLGVRREIAAHVANVLQVRGLGNEAIRFTQSAEARRCYLNGLYLASRLSEAEIMQAIDFYQRAIGYDRDYSPAYAALSEAYITLALWNEGPPNEMSMAAEAARMAVRTGDKFPHAHAALGSVLALYNWDWAGAEKEFRKAIDADPNDSLLRQQYAIRYLVPQANLDSALFELQRAQWLDRFSPEVLLNRGWVRNLKRDPTGALADVHSALGLDRELEVAPLVMAEAYLQSSRLDEASKTLQSCMDPTGDEVRLALLGSVYGLSRKPERAREVLRQLTELDRHYQHISGYYFSQVHMALGETSPALTWLEKAVDERSPQVAYLNVTPQFDVLRAEPRFHALLKRTGLER